MFDPPPNKHSTLLFVELVGRTFAPRSCDGNAPEEEHPARWVVWSDEDTGDGYRQACDEDLAGWVEAVMQRVDADGPGQALRPDWEIGDPPPARSTRLCVELLGRTHGPGLCDVGADHAEHIGRWAVWTEQPSEEPVLRACDGDLAVIVDRVMRRVDQDLR